MQTINFLTADECSVRWGSEFFLAIFWGNCHPKGLVSSLGIYSWRLPKDVGFCRESRSPLPSVYTSHPTRLRYGKWYGNEWGGMGGSNLLGSTRNFSRNPHRFQKQLGWKSLPMDSSHLSFMVSGAHQSLKSEMCLHQQKKGTPWRVDEYST